MSDSDPGEEPQQPTYDVITPDDAPRPVHPVSRSWIVVSRGIDGRYREIVVDRQDSFTHALSLVEAYTTPGEDLPGFIPDAVVVRDGSVVPLLRAAEAILEWARETGSSGDLISNLSRAVDMATDPCLDVGDTDPSALTLAQIREEAEAGAWACREVRPRSANPHPQCSPLWLHWDRGWELESIGIGPPTQEDDETT